MQIKHSATRDYSDHLITFQSGLPHVSHQSLQNKGEGPALRVAQSHRRRSPGLYQLTCCEPLVLCVLVCKRSAKPSS